jgi:hypothetical protein
MRVKHEEVSEAGNKMYLHYVTLQHKLVKSHLNGIFCSFKLPTSAYGNGSNAINLSLVCVTDMNALSTHSTLMLYQLTVITVTWNELKIYIPATYFV